MPAIGTTALFDETENEYPDAVVPPRVTCVVPVPHEVPEEL
jgi:hypothetical protein